MVEWEPEGGVPVVELEWMGSVAREREWGWSRRVVTVVRMDDDPRSFPPGVARAPRLGLRSKAEALEPPGECPAST